jgi:hypothetical protein
LLRTFTCSLSLLLLLNTGPNAFAALVIHDARFVSEQRISNPRTYPLAIDSDGSIYSVTGTAVSDDFIRVSTDNTVTTLNNSVGRVFGVISDIEFGFGGDLFANYAQLPNNDSGTHGIARLDKSTGAISTFYSGPSFNADGGLAFNATSSVLYMHSQLAGSSLLAFDSLGNATTVVAGLGEGRGLAIEDAGTLITIGETEIRRVDPTVASVSTVRDIAADLPGYKLRSVDVLSTGEIVFTAQNDSTLSRSLFSISSFGGPLNLIATDAVGGPHQIKFGVSRDGLGESLYLNNPDTLALYELRLTAVPEPSSLAILSTGVVILIMRRRKARNKAIPRERRKTCSLKPV